MDRILVQKNGETLLEYCPDRERTRIGSDPAGDIALAGEGGVSWNHAELVRSGAGYVIRDLGSLAGLFVNGEKVAEKELTAGDAVTVGEFTLVCAGGTAAPAAEPMPPAEPEPAAQSPAEPLPPAVPEPAAEQLIVSAAGPVAEGVTEPLPPAGPEPEAEPAAEPEPPAPAAQSGAAWDAEATVIIPRKTAAAEETPASMPEQNKSAQAPDRFEATNILRAPGTGEAPPPVVPPPSRAEAAPAGQDDHFAITSILKVPKKSAASPSAPAADLEDGVIEIEVPETPFWSRRRLAGAAALGAAAVCAAAGLSFLRSPELLAGLMPPTQISFNVLPEDAQVYVNGAQMPGAGSGVLRNIPPGRFSIKVSHYAYPSPLAIEVETGLFKRVARVDASQEGISSR